LKRRQASGEIALGTGTVILSAEQISLPIRGRTAKVEPGKRGKKGPAQEDLCRSGLDQLTASRL